ncbi:MAG: hypothetical protein LBJ82_01880, partial [Deltaproteobacteria bacterium]|nr:hypothetical protein [Deltaproteobacteria bacterium]
MPVYRVILVLLVACALPGFGCTYNQHLKDAWKYSNRQFRAYVNTPAVIDMEATGDCEAYELALGESVLTMDDQLQRFVRAMENGDRNPDQNWVLGIMRRFPWLSGVALVDAAGQPLARYPEYFIKEFDVTPLLEADPKQNLSALRAYVQQSPFGPEVYLAHPVFSNGDLRGLVVAYFDPRALAGLSEEADQFMLASPAGVIWGGQFDAANTPVGQVDWEEMLARRSRGLLGSSENRFFWTTRYVGNMPLVYAISTNAVDRQMAPAALEQPMQETSGSQPPKTSDSAATTGVVGNIG